MRHRPAAGARRLRYRGRVSVKASQADGQEHLWTALAPLNIEHQCRYIIERVPLIARLACTMQSLIRGAWLAHDEIKLLCAAR